MPSPVGNDVRKVADGAKYGDQDGSPQPEPKGSGENWEVVQPLVEVVQERGMDGRSETYRKAMARLEAYRQPSPPPLRAVSGYRGLMRAMPSEQSAKNSRSGVLSALKLE